MQPFQALTKSETVELLDLIHACIGCSNMHDFILIVEGLRSLLDFDSIIYCQLLKKAVGYVPYHIVNIGFPGDWVTIYSDDTYRQVGLVIKETETLLGVQYWDETFSMQSPRPKIISMVKDLGVVKGYMVTNRQRPLMHQNMISFAGINLEASERSKLILERIAPHIGYSLEIAVNVQSCSALKSQDVKSPLTQREKEVMEWIKDGKTSWEVSIILNISERTVNFHINNVKDKLNAVSRGQAVAAAIQKGLIG